MISRKHRKHKKTYTIHNKSSKICQQSKQSIKTLTSDKILSSYTKYLSLIVNKFTNNTNHKRILESIFTIKDKLDGKENGKIKPNLRPLLYMKHSPMDFELDATLKIPNFIELFQYLMSIPTFNKYFTKEEINDFNTVLSSHFGNINKQQNEHQNEHQIYDYLHNNPIGAKIADTYNKEYYNLNLSGTLDSKFPSIKFHQLLINSFTSYKILEDIEKYMTSLSIGSLEYNKNTNKHKYDNLLYIFSDAQEDKDARYSSEINSEFRNIHYLGYEIIQRLLFFNEFLGTDKLPNKLIIFLTNQEKEIDDALEHKAHFRSLNVNTAVTNGQDIIIYREQELLKSVFHELIHFHQLDFRTIPPNSEKVVMDYLKKTHNIAENNEYLLYECITESLANILNNIYSGDNTYSRGKQTFLSFKKKFIDELLFSTFQVAKILRICKYNSWAEFALLESNSNSAPKHNPAKQFKQDSCVFSYYILKLYILLNIDEYWNTILDNHLKFIPNEDNFNKLIGIFEKGRKDIHLAIMINSILQGTAKSNFHSKFHRKIHKTLRMTCVE